MRMISDKVETCTYHNKACAAALLGCRMCLVSTSHRNVKVSTSPTLKFLSHGNELLGSSFPCALTFGCPSESELVPRPRALSVSCCGRGDDFSVELRVPGDVFLVPGNILGVDMPLPLQAFVGSPCSFSCAFCVVSIHCALCLC